MPLGKILLFLIFVAVHLKRKSKVCEDTHTHTHTHTVSDSHVEKKNFKFDRNEKITFIRSIKKCLQFIEFNFSASAT